MKLETFGWDVDADGIATATFDVPGRSMNTLTAQAIADLGAIAKEVADERRYRGPRHHLGQEERLLRRRRPRRTQQRFGSGDKGDPEAQPQGGVRAFVRDEQAAPARWKPARSRWRAPSTVLRSVAVSKWRWLPLPHRGQRQSETATRPAGSQGRPDAGRWRHATPARASWARRRLRRSCCRATAWTAEQAKANGVVHELAPTAELVAKAKAWCKANPNAKAPSDDPRVQGPGRQSEFATGLDRLHVRLGHAGQADLGRLPAQKHILSAVY